MVARSDVVNPMPIQRVHFIEYNPKVNTLGSRAILPKYGTPLLAAILRERGLAVRIFLEGVSDMNFEEMTDCDLVCFPVYGPALTKVRDCARRIRRERPQLPIIMGGPFVCLATDTVLDVCDYAVRGEGDEVLPELIDCLSRGADEHAVSGISFLEGGHPVHTPDRPPPPIPATIPDLTLIEGFDRATRGTGRREVMNTLQTSRGCNFRCKFCSAAKLFAGVYRNRDIDSIIEDLRAKLRYNKYFLVVDNSFLSNRKRTIELLHRLAKENLGAHLIIFERHEIGKDTELLQLMWKAGVHCIIVGIESLVDENLRIYDKRQTSRDVAASVQNILENNIHVIGTFILGGDGDTRETAADIVRFVKSTGISMNLLVFILHEMEEDEINGPIIPLSRRFRTYYTRRDPNNLDYYDYLTGNFVTYFPKRMKPSTLQQCMVDTYQEVYSHREILRRAFSKNVFNSIFGVAHAFGMKRLSETVIDSMNNYYLDFLRQIEQGLYDKDEVLIDERLASLESLPVPKRLEPRLDNDSYRNLMSLYLLPGFIRERLTQLRQSCSAIWASRTPA